jgi:hypothetical protein
MWLNRLGVSASYSRYRVFPAGAGWEYTSNWASLISGNIKTVTLSRPPLTCDFEHPPPQSSFNGQAGGNAQTSIPANKKIYFEMRDLSGGAFNGGHGLHNSLSSTLGSQWIRSWRLNPADQGPDRGDSYVGSNASPGAYAITSGNESDMRFAVDTINGRVWMSYGPSGTWYGGGDPAAGTSPSFNIDVTGWYLYASAYYTSCGSGSAFFGGFFNSLSEFLYTPPNGFDYNL